MGAIVHCNNVPGQATLTIFPRSVPAPPPPPSFASLLNRVSVLASRFPSSLYSTTAHSAVAHALREVMFPPIGYPRFLAPVTSSTAPLGGPRRERFRLRETPSRACLAYGAGMNAYLLADHEAQRQTLVSRFESCSATKPPHQDSMRRRPVIECDIAGRERARLADVKELRWERRSGKSASPCHAFPGKGATRRPGWLSRRRGQSWRHLEEC